jgi:hypothetical protein
MPEGISGASGPESQEFFIRVTKEGKTKSSPTVGRIISKLPKGAQKILSNLIGNVLKNKEALEHLTQATNKDGPENYALLWKEAAAKLGHETVHSHADKITDELNKVILSQLIGGVTENTTQPVSSWKELQTTMAAIRDKPPALRKQELANAIRGIDFRNLEGMNKEVGATLEALRDINSRDFLQNLLDSIPDENEITQEIVLTRFSADTRRLAENTELLREVPSLLGDIAKREIHKRAGSITFSDAVLGMDMVLGMQENLQREVLKQLGQPEFKEKCDPWTVSAIATHLELPDLASVTEPRTAKELASSAIQLDNLCVSLRSLGAEKFDELEAGYKEKLADVTEKFISELGKFTTPRNGPDFLTKNGISLENVAHIYGSISSSDTKMKEDLVNALVEKMPQDKLLALLKNKIFSDRHPDFRHSILNKLGIEH